MAKSMAEGPTHRAPLHEGQSRRSPDVRLRHRARPRGRTTDPPTTTADHKEAVQAFIDKRKPVFTGQCRRNQPGSGGQNRAQFVSRKRGIALAGSRGEPPARAGNFLRGRHRYVFRSAPASSRPGIGGKAKPDLRASPIMASLERSVSPNKCSAPNAAAGIPDFSAAPCQCRGPASGRRSTGRIRYFRCRCERHSGPRRQWSQSRRPAWSRRH